MSATIICNKKYRFQLKNSKLTFYRRFQLLQGQINDNTISYVQSKDIFSIS